ncbi:DUF305 domain-containing protein [Bradyrhizobium ganzhouense]|uniref:DUF305 domain-containing protein n=1 Tax=Bradyrhizobium ganzhouense TaxID=1179767 RepID=UPI003CF96B3D
MPLFSRRFVRRRAISLATSLSVMATSFALAQGPKHNPDARRARDTDKHHVLFDGDLATNNMSRTMLTAPTGDIDRDPIDVMAPHYQGAIDMARAEIRYGRNDDIRQEIFSPRHALSVANLMPSTGVEIGLHAPN